MRRLDGKRFLLRQIEYHKPAILIFAGTQSCVQKPWKGGSNKELSALARNTASKLVETVWTIEEPKRLSLGLRSQRQIEFLQEEYLKHENVVIQSIINLWSQSL